MKETSKTIQKWHEESFPDATLDGQLEKFGEEIKEYREAESDEDKLAELADLLIVAAGIARFDKERSQELTMLVHITTSEDGYDMTELWDAVQKKMEKNRKRVWNKTGDGTYHHENGIED